MWRNGRKLVGDVWLQSMASYICTRCANWSPQRKCETHIIYLNWSIDVCYYRLYHGYYQLYTSKQKNSELIGSRLKPFSEEIMFVITKLLLSAQRFSLFSNFICIIIHEIRQSPAGWGSRIHQLHLCRGERPSQQMSLIWYKTIWWRCSSLGDWNKVEYLFMAITSRSSLS